MTDTTLQTDPALAKKMRLHKSTHRLLVMPDAVADQPAIWGIAREDFITAADQKPFDAVFAYVFTLEEMKAAMHRFAGKGFMTAGGILYLAYPKKGNRAFPQHIDRDAIFPHLNVDEETGQVPGTDFYFNLMVRLNEVFTLVGLKQSDNRPDAKKAVAASQRTEDYVHRVPDVEQALENDPEAQALFQALTPGYQANWARYVYSAKQEATRQKRLEEMKTLLKAGYKSKDQYRKKES